MRGRNVAKECSNNNEICYYAWNISMRFQALRPARAKRVFSPIRRLSCARRTSAQFDLHRQSPRRERWRESNPRFQLRGLSDLPEMTETATKFPVVGTSSPYPPPSLGELKHRIRASTAFRCLPARSTRRVRMSIRQSDEIVVHGSQFLVVHFSYRLPRHFLAELVTRGISPRAHRRNEAFQRPVLHKTEARPNGS